MPSTHNKWHIGGILRAVQSILLREQASYFRAIILGQLGIVEC